jgi:hypothetical protein
MTGQPWLAATFAGLMIITVGYCLARLGLSWRRRRPTDRPVDAMHVLMGVAMTGMLVPGLRVLGAGGWEIVFAASGALFLVRIARALSPARRRGAAPASTARASTARASTARASTGHQPAHDGQHVLSCAAMLYMLAATASGHAPGRGVAAGAMSGAAGSPTLALILAVALLGCVVWTADRISALTPVAALASAAPAADAAGAAGASSLAGPPARWSLAASRRAVPLSPRLAGCCEIVIGVTMGYMLIVLL